jgi:glycine/serine hydroxymethyltransferase
MSTTITPPDGDKRFVGKIDLGAVVQAITVLCSTVAGLITAGGFVQSIAHDLHVMTATQTAILAAEQETAIALRALLQDRAQRIPAAVPLPIAGQHVGD